MSETDNSKIVEAALAAFAKKDADTLLSHCAEGFVFTIGDPVGQDAVPFFGVYVGHDQFRQWLSDHEEGPFQMVACSTGNIDAAEFDAFAAGDAEYVFKSTGDKISTTTMTHCRIVAGKIVEMRRWMEGTRFYRKNETAAA
ncbi:nuclear transport factor 2 family protein [Ruegeria halocynthiae]|uniref:nuclear transport factor 2 family protein n=1 Tax=Ruegeria halocynthiae TaxID=985054 RepID=UPI000A867BBD|nr:nuclear transport factor 2 family protein [Ruegeria halocynthiae]